MLTYKMAGSGEGARFSSSFLFDKAFVDGQWVTAKSGKTFEGKLLCVLLGCGVIEDDDNGDDDDNDDSNTDNDNKNYNTDNDDDVYDDGVERHSHFTVSTQSSKLSLTCTPMRSRCNHVQITSNT